MLADSLAKVPDFFVIQSDIGKKSACYLCLLSPGWKNTGLFSGKRGNLFLIVKTDLVHKGYAVFTRVGGTKREIKNEWLTHTKLFRLRMYLVIHFLTMQCLGMQCLVRKPIFPVHQPGWGTRVYLWRIHVDIWQNQYNIVKLKKNKERSKKENPFSNHTMFGMHACRVNVWVSSIYAYIFSFYYKLVLFLSQTSFALLQRKIFFFPLSLFFKFLASFLFFLIF